MWLRVSTPAFSAPEPTLRVTRTYAVEGDWLDRGQSLMDLTVDMSGGVERDCPPISTCRIVLREGAWLRSQAFQAGAEVAPGATLALLSSEADSPPEAPARDARVTVATVLQHADWWADDT